MDKTAKLENIKLNKSEYFECVNHCSNCNTTKCKLLIQAIKVAESNGQIIRG